MLKFILICSFATLPLSLTLEPGCPAIKQVDLSFSKWTPGVWYQLAKYPHNIETIQRCVGFNIEPNSTGFVAITNVTQSSRSFTRAEGNLVDKSRAIFNLTLLTENPPQAIHVPEYYYLGFEENKFFIGYGCNYDPINKDYREYIFIFSKTANVPIEIKDKIEKIITSSDVVDVNKLIWADHSGCETE